MDCGHKDPKSSSKDQMCYRLVDTFCALEALTLSLRIKKSHRKMTKEVGGSRVGTVGWGRVETDGF